MDSEQIGLLQVRMSGLTPCCHRMPGRGWRWAMPASRINRTKGVDCG